MIENSVIYKRACESIPGGVNSPVRAFKSVGRPPVFAWRASGSRIWDVEGREYIDLIGAWGPLIAGHSHPEVVAAICRAAQEGCSYGLSHPRECELAEEIKRRAPGVELIRFVNSGTEAAMSAVRLARAFTGRSKVVKFAGCYHGHSDAFLVAAGSGIATHNLPDSPGITQGAAEDTIIAKHYNDLDEVKRIFDELKDRIAAVMVEPIAGNMGVVPPVTGFLPGLRSICDEYGAVLIFDEVITGFRAGVGGAQELYRVRPDLTLFGKIIGGGLPVGAFGGRRDIMSLLAPEGPVYQAGTLSGNPLAMAAGLATLKLLNTTAYNYLESIGQRLESGLTAALERQRTPGVVQRVGSMLTLFFSPTPIRNFDDAKNADHKVFAQFFNRMFERGVLLPPSGYEAWFLSLAHRREDVERILECVE